MARLSSLSEDEVFSLIKSTWEKSQMLGIPISFDISRNITLEKQSHEDEYNITINGTTPKAFDEQARILEHFIADLGYSTSITLHLLSGEDVSNSSIDEFPQTIAGLKAIDLYATFLSDNLNVFQLEGLGVSVIFKTKISLSDTMIETNTGMLDVELSGGYHHKEILTEMSNKFDELFNTLPNNFRCFMDIFCAGPPILATIGVLCSNCSQEITQAEGKWICVACCLENTQWTFCCACGQNEDDPIASPVHEHPLLFVPPNGDDYVENGNIKSCLEVKFESTVQENPNKVIEHISCDNCGKHPVFYDWECAICEGHYDLCWECKEISLNVNNELHSTMMWRNHKPEHPLLRIPYHLQGKSIMMIIAKRYK